MRWASINLIWFASGCSINFSFVSSIIGLVVLLPINYFNQDKPSRSYHSLDSLTISNVREGSDWLVTNLLAFSVSLAMSHFLVGYRLISTLTLILLLILYFEVNSVSMANLI